MHHIEAEQTFVNKSFITKTVKITQTLIGCDCCTDLTLACLEQGHHHNCDQASRRPHMMCSICGCRFATPPVWGMWETGMGSFDSLPMGSYQLAIDTHGLALTIFELCHF